AGDRRLNEGEQAMADRQGGDDQLGGVAERRIQQAAQPGAELVSQVFGRFAYQAGQWNEGDRREDEENEVGSAEKAGEHGTRHEQQDWIERSGHGRPSASPGP